MRAPPPQTPFIKHLVSRPKLCACTGKYGENPTLVISIRKGHAFTVSRLMGLCSLSFEMKNFARAPASGLELTTCATTAAACRLFSLHGKHQPRENMEKKVHRRKQIKGRGCYKNVPRSNGGNQHRQHQPKPRKKTADGSTGDGMFLSPILSARDTPAENRVLHKAFNKICPHRGGGWFDTFPFYYPPSDQGGRFISCPPFQN